MVTLVKQGISNFRRNATLWGWLYLARLVLTLVFTLPLLILVNAVVDSSVFASSLLKTWSLDVIVELVTTREQLFPSLVAVLAFYAVAVFLVKQFLNGGIYVSYLSAGRTDHRRFFSESAEQFNGNLKISFFMLVIYVPLLVIWQIVYNLIPTGLTGHYGAGALVSILLRFVPLYLLMIAGSIFSELLRLRLAACPGEKLMTSVREALRFYIKRVVTLNGTYYIFFIPFALLWLLIENQAISVTGGLGNLGGVLLEAMLFQLCALARTGQSLIYTASVASALRAVVPGRFAVTQEVGSDH